tara:strand:+ start:1026 stop:1151 length:126 start_codon:yes stop_codon:yes gene_type:complete
MIIIMVLIGNINLNTFNNKFDLLCDPTATAFLEKEGGDERP